MGHAQGENGMSNTDTGGPAFPTEAYDLERQTLVREEGMTLRDYFAAKAMQGILTDPEIVMGATEIADLSYKYADAMLKAREA
jgi:hypothetical protein